MNRACLAFAGASVIAMALTTPSTANATTTRTFPMTMCQQACDDNDAADCTSSFTPTPGVVFDVTTGQLSVITPNGVGPFFTGPGEGFSGVEFACGLTSDTSVPLGESAHLTSSVQFNGFANEFGVAIAACRTFRNGGGGACGARAFATNGVYHVTPNDMSAWNNAGSGDQFYLLVVAASTDPTGSHNTLFSYQVFSTVQ